MQGITLENDWLYAEFLPRGAALSRLVYKPLNRDVVLRNQNASLSYHYVNTIVGPIANRVSGAAFQSNGKTILLEQNDATNCLHGGSTGLSECDWTGEKTKDGVRFEVSRSDEELGYIGNCFYDAEYQLVGQALRITLSAICDQHSAANLVPHLYFTLGGDVIDDLTLSVNADQYLPVDKQTLPTGDVAEVDETPFDFRSPRKIGDSKFDHNLCLNGSAPVATLTYDGLALQVATDAPGLQIYDADHLGRVAIAIEPQGWPNSVNQPAFPNQFVKPNIKWTTHSEFKFAPT